MRFNFRSWVSAAGLAAILAAAGLSFIMAQSKEGGSPSPLPRAADLTAAQKQGLARLRGAWWMSRVLKEYVWKDFDPNAIPVLMVERRPGRKPWALLMNHPAPPKDFLLAAADEPDLPAVLVSPSVNLPPVVVSPYEFAGRSVAIFLVGENVPDTPCGEEASERVTPKIVHEMEHLYAVSKGASAIPAGAAAPPYPKSPEMIALGSVENQILAEFLYADVAKSALLQDLAKQFVAVRRARAAMMGPAAEVEQRFESWEGPAVYAEFQVLKVGGGPQKMLEPPPAQDADPTSHAFQFALLWRLDLIIGRLTTHPSEAAHLAARTPYTGVAQILMIERLGSAPTGWLETVLTGKRPAVQILADRLGMEPAQQEEALAKARDAYGYAAALALARAR